MALLIIVVGLNISFAEPSFFPNKIFSGRQDQHDFTAGWYSKHLLAMDEPSMWQQSKKSNLHTYRFLWLRTFDRPICIRLIVNSDGSGSLITKATNGQGGYNPGRATHHKTIELSKEQTTSFLHTVKLSRFWKLPPYNNKDVGVDGAQWVIEGVKKGRYHIVDRWSPSGAIREAALVLVRFSQITVGPIY